MPGNPACATITEAAAPCRPVTQTGASQTIPDIVSIQCTYGRLPGNVVGDADAGATSSHGGMLVEARVARDQECNLAWAA